MKTVQLIISGRVQGVYFRFFTQKQAVKRGVVGFVRNKADGSVEVIASGGSEKLQLFINWCRKGPILAKVKNVILNDYPTQEQFTQFDIR